MSGENDYDKVLDPHIGKTVNVYLLVAENNSSEVRPVLSVYKGVLTKGELYYGVHSNSASVLLIPGLPMGIEIEGKIYDISKLKSTSRPNIKQIARLDLPSYDLSDIVS